MFELWLQSKKNPEMYKAVTVYDVKYDGHGYPRFLIYLDRQWRFLSAKHFRPLEEYVQHENTEKVASLLIDEYYDRLRSVVEPKEEEVTEERAELTAAGAIANLRDLFEKRMRDPSRKRKQILAEAFRCVCGSREQDYGSPENNFAAIARLWNAFLGDRIQKEITPVDVAVLLALLKIARIGSGHGKMDNWVDLAGYAACGGELEEIMNKGECHHEDDPEETREVPAAEG